ncbi:hypothetical protein DPMN_079731 [Dreissena polymorpha]|uniref:Uncharacterized protein n=1 Tax=Dreissena polymorpha TaxID=45954 RepID=A0A9D4BT84_DREPO|nr:hypothetical protein DPMN_079731 [Dreissena polymorpha]
MEASVTRTTATQAPPKKMPLQLAKQIINMPGKKEREISFTKRTVCKYPVYSITFNSNKDKCSKKHWLQAERLGCEEEGCDFWVHAVCANVKLASRNSIP